MGLGFVVARFGLFVTLMSASSVSPAGGHRSHWPSSALGIALVLLGAGAILGALWLFGSRRSGFFWRCIL
jgi:putative membrane protein